jgi:hypothetical protein
MIAALEDHAVDGLGSAFDGRNAGGVSCRTSDRNQEEFSEHWQEYNPFSMTFETVRKTALALPNVADGKSYGFPALKFRGKVIVVWRENLDSIVLRTDFEARDEMMAADPGAYYITDHYRDYPWVLVRLSKVKKSVLADLLKRACRLA